MVPTILGPQFERLFGANLIFSARAQEYSVRGFPGPFSIKGVVRGEAVWRIAGQRFVVDSASWLIVDRMSPYDLDIHSVEPVETFVVFFADALLADVATTRLTATQRLLDDPDERSAVELPVTQRLWTGVTEFQQALASLRQASQSSAESCEGVCGPRLPPRAAGRAYRRRRSRRPCARSRAFQRSQSKDDQGSDLRPGAMSP